MEEASREVSAEEKQAKLAIDPVEEKPAAETNSVSDFHNESESFESVDLSVEDLKE